MKASGGDGRVESLGDGASLAVCGRGDEDVRVSLRRASYNSVSKDACCGRARVAKGASFRFFGVYWEAVVGKRPLSEQARESVVRLCEE